MTRTKNWNLIFNTDLRQRVGYDNFARVVTHNNTTFIEVYPKKFAPEGTRKLWASGNTGLGLTALQPEIQLADFKLTKGCGSYYLIESECSNELEGIFYFRISNVDPNYDQNMFTFPGYKMSISENSRDRSKTNLNPDRKKRYAHYWAQVNKITRRNKQLMPPSNMHNESVDHLYSVFSGFNNGVAPEVVGCLRNLDWKVRSHNSSKSAENDISLQELNRRYKDCPCSQGLKCEPEKNSTSSNNGANIITTKTINYCNDTICCAINT